VHANWRYFELYGSDGERKDCWFGGGTDLTPYYLAQEDGQHFHLVLKNAITPFGADLYPQFKNNCDEYFTNKHRSNEMRGIGGVFYDYLRPGAYGMNEEALVAFQKANGNAFTDAYIPIVQLRKDTPYGQDEVNWQEIRRGRYVEFNLIHDRGTLFGLKTNGRTESILMSLPPRARWQYDHQPEPGSREAAMMQNYYPRTWI
jgi:coproporphyrinogen III oxidase